MKLHRLEIENINALEGKHVIDFDAHFADAPLLLICGDTGAGKSSILDAIHLALFACTPRLTSTSASRVDTDKVTVDMPANVMTHGTSKSSSLLEFSVLDESGHRARYRTFWEISRARGKVDGNFQGVRREIQQYNVSNESWEMLSAGQKVREHDEVMSVVLRGMKADEFQRVIMLAQGRFDALLLATPAERAVILARVIDVSTFERIGAKVAEIHAEKKAALKAMTEALAAAAGGLLTEEAIAALTQQIAEETANIQAAQKERDAVSARLVWGKHRDEAADALTKVEATHATAAQELLTLAPTAAAVEEHHRLVPAWQEYLLLQRAKSDFERMNKDYVTASDEVVKSTAKIQPLKDAFASAGERRTEASAAREAAAPQLAAAIDAWKARDLAVQDQRLATDAWTRSAAALTAAAERLAERQKAAGAAATALQEATAARDALALSDDALPLEDPLLAAQTALASAVQALADAKRTHDETASALQKLHERRRTSAASHASLVRMKDELQTASQAIAQEAGLPADIGAASIVEALLAKHADLRSDELDAAALQTVLQRLDAQVTERGEIAPKLAATHGALAQLEATIAASAGIDAARLVQREGLSAQLATTQRFIQMVDALADGHDCPLCGSQQHGDASARRHEMQDLLTTLQTQVESLQAEIHAAELSARERSKERDTLRQSLTTLQSTIDALDKERLTLDATRTTLSGERRAAGKDLWGTLEQATAARATLSETMATVKAVGERARELSNAVIAHSSNFSASQSALASLDEQLENATTRAADERARYEASSLAHASAVDTMRSLVGNAALRASAQLADVASAGAAELALAARRVLVALRAYAAALTTVAGRTEKHATCVQEQAAQQRIVDDATTLEATARALRTERDAATAKAEAFCGTFFDGREPEQVRGLLDAEKTKTAEAFDLAQAALSKEEGQLKSLIGSAEARKEVRATSEAAFGTAQASFDALLAMLAVDGPATLEARHMDDASLQEAVTRLDAARKRLDEQRVRLDELQKRMATVLAQTPESGVPQEDDPARIDALDVEQTRARDATAQATESLRANEQRNTQQAAERLALRDAEDKLSVWTELQSLVGTNRGKAFSHFALALSLQDLIWRANKQLASLAPRYMLEQRWEGGEPKLDFVIVDLDASASKRPLTTLSGGERFLISLALALALADTTGSNLTVETLMIDEGFGTLDSETLQRAIGALESLQSQRGAQVALISHVVGLRERIPAQIRLKKLGGGRSSIVIQG